MSRILAQPIYRDALLFGKFLAALLALTIGLVSLWLLVLGLGLLLFGLPPSTEEIVRMLGFLVATIAYGGVWLAVALLFSVMFRAPATAALAALGAWLLFALFWSVIAPLLANLIAGPPEGIFGPRTGISASPADDRPPLAQHPLWRNRAGAAAPGDARLGTGADQPAARALCWGRRCRRRRASS